MIIWLYQEYGNTELGMIGAPTRIFAFIDLEAPNTSQTPVTCNLRNLRTAESLRSTGTTS